MIDMKVIVGGGLDDDASAFVDAWRRAEHGQVAVESVLAFESWEGLATVMTGARLRLLRQLHAHPQPSISALARYLNRQYRRVHADVVALEEAGLLGRDNGGVYVTADRITAEVQLSGTPTGASQRT